MKQNRKHILRLSIYSLILVVVVLLTVALVAIGRGYRYDFETGQIISGGLILIDSEPNGATIYLDGKQINKRSPTRLPVKAGSHNLNLTKDGYRSWQKTLPVVRTEVSWVQYPFLVPLAIDTQSLGEVDQVSNWAQSQDGKLLAMVSSGPPPAMRLLEVGKQELKAVYQPSPEEQAQGVQ
ncbi:PEGA domain-containing protein, partial [Candidatus Microgenomates bacterium]|nr:PEGA domain-containing protein [Candidatus Microgenomates bacterium]